MIKRWRLARITGEGTEVLPDKFWTRRSAKQMADFLNGRLSITDQFTNALAGWAYFPVSERGVKVLKRVQMHLTVE